ncbi:hypothetical protein PanWU01x14_034710, partial [Parasponia andersonii]
MGSAQSNSCLNNWKSEASRVFCQKIIGGSALLQTQTVHLIQSWVGVRIRQTVLTGWRVAKVSPLPDSYHKGRRKVDHNNAKEITVTTACDFR